MRITPSVTVSNVTLPLSLSLSLFLNLSLSLFFLLFPFFFGRTLSQFNCSSPSFRAPPSALLLVTSLNPSSNLFLICLMVFFIIFPSFSSSYFYFFFFHSCRLNQDLRRGYKSQNKDVFLPLFWFKKKEIKEKKNLNIVECNQLPQLSLRVFWSYSVLCYKRYFHSSVSGSLRFVVLCCCMAFCFWQYIDERDDFIKTILQLWLEHSIPSYWTMPRLSPHFIYAIVFPLWW